MRRTAVVVLVALTLAGCAPSDRDGNDEVESYPACTAEDGPAPCVWDNAIHGDGKGGPGVARYVIVR